MLKEHVETGGVSLSKFYLRRTIRILPVYLAFLLTLGALQQFTKIDLDRSAWVWIRNLTFTTNFIGSSDRIGDHLWSLGIEEQFYLIWPAVFVGFRLADRKSLAFVVLAIPLFVAPLSRSIDHKSFCPLPLGYLFHDRAFFNYFDSIALGCLGAFLYSVKRSMAERFLWLDSYFASGLAIGLIVAPAILYRERLLGLLTVPFGNTLQAVGVLTLILQSLETPTTGFFKILNVRSLSVVGLMSYSVYIWQQPFFVFATIAPFDRWHILQFPLIFVPIALISLVSYQCIELPLAKFRARYRN